jgi:hypothetical protein
MRFKEGAMTRSTPRYGGASAKAAVPTRLPWAAILTSLLLALAVIASGPALAQDERLIGVWRGTETSLLGAMATEAIFFPNGTYSRAHVLGSLMTRDTGTYQIVQNWIHFNLENWGPTEYMGQPLTWPTSDTWVVTYFDGNVLETENIHLERVQ